MSVPLINSAITESLHTYIDMLDGEKPNDLYDLAMNAAEESVIRFGMALAEDNQTLAAELLGMNRGTFIVRLKKYGILTKED